MKTISDALNAHLQQEVTTLAWMWKIVRRDGQSFYFTTHDIDIVYEGATYKSLLGFTNTSVPNKSDFSVDSLGVTGIFDDETITLTDLRAGLFDYASVYLFLVNWDNLSQGQLNLRRGYFGECVASPQGWYQVELRGLTQLLQQNTMEEYGPSCRADLGGPDCTKPIDPPLWAANHTYKSVLNMLNTNCWCKAVVNSDPGYAAYGNVIFECTTAGTSGSTQPDFDTTIGATTADGTAVWTARAAWTCAAHVASVTDGANFTVAFDTVAGNVTLSDPTFLVFGQVMWLTGANAGKAMEIKTWDGTSAIQTVLPTGYIPQVGDLMAITPGCNKTLAHCRDKYNNLYNKRSEDYLIGDDEAFSYAI